MNKRGNFRKFGVKGNDETWRPMLLADGMRERVRLREALGPVALLALASISEERRVASPP